MNNSSNLSIILGDCLPTTYDVAINIFNICSNPKSQKMKNCVKAYATALILQWTKAFGEEYVLKIKQVQSKLLTVVNNYFSKVYKEQTRDKSGVKKSLRQLNKEWRQSNIFTGRHKNVPLVVDKLFDIGKNMDTLTGDEACFYTDQLSSRCGRISEDVDLKYVTEKQTELELAQAALKRDMCEESYISEVDVEPSVSSSNDGRSTIISTNRSGLVRLTKNHSNFAVQCCLSNRPSVRTVRNFTDTIKNTLCEISVKCNL